MKLKNALLGLSLTLAVVGTTGCAAAFRPRLATINVESQPDDVELRMAGRTVGRSSKPVGVPRIGHKRVQVHKEGYEQTSFVLQRRMNVGWAIWDIATCVVPVALCIPLYVDAVSGAWMGVKPDYQVSMHPEGQEASKSASTESGEGDRTSPRTGSATFASAD